MWAGRWRDAGGIKELKKKGKSPAEVENKPVLCICPPSSGETRWTGGVYSVYLDKRADAYVTPLDANRLHVKGCKFVETRLTCAEDVWTRSPYALASRSRLRERQNLALPSCHQPWQPIALSCTRWCRRRCRT